MPKSRPKVAHPGSAADRYIRINGLEAYYRVYQYGWVFKGQVEESKYQYDDAFWDGYLDCHADRPKWHLMICPDHNKCP